MTFQTGQQRLTGFPTSGLIPIDNGGPQHTVLPEAAGTFTINGVTPVTVVAPSITAGSIVLTTLKTVGGTVGAVPAIQTITPGTGFTVLGTAADTSIYNYVIIG